MKDERSRRMRHKNSRLRTRNLVLAKPNDTLKQGGTQDLGNNSSLQQTTALKGFENAIVYVDYENVSELIKRYGKDALEINFFAVIQKLIRDLGLTIVDFIVYSNFEKNGTAKTQSIIRTMGLQTRHASNNGKNSSDLELTVDALRALYKTPNISVFVIISSDRDIIPLLKAIRYEGKFSYVLSTRNGFNQVVAEYADLHQYIEDIFGFTGLQVKDDMKPVDKIFDLLFEGSIPKGMIERAREVANLFYDSLIWKKSLTTKEPVSLSGYINVISKRLNRLPGDLLNDFKVAHYLHYVTIYADKDTRLYLREGEKKDEVNNNKG
jgi:uncharacterized LabA/DUF88 family protein